MKTAPLFRIHAPSRYANARGLSIWAILACAIGMAAQPPAKTILLWPDGAPGAIGTTAEDQPRLDVYLPGVAPAAPLHSAVVILPGGGYQHLATQKEGIDPALWFNKLGVSAFVLTYRLAPRYHYPAQLDDAARALRYVRMHAADYGIDPNRIGMMGSSAGGHLASTLGTHFSAGDAAATDAVDRVSSRPDFLVLEYPVIDYVGGGSMSTFKFLLGGADPPDAKMVALLSNDKAVTAQTPPTFLVAASDDPIVPTINSFNFYWALVRAKVPAELHLYENGGHGFGLHPVDKGLSDWLPSLNNWLQIRGLLGPAASQK